LPYPVADGDNGDGTESAMSWYPIQDQPNEEPKMFKSKKNRKRKAPLYDDDGNEIHNSDDDDNNDTDGFDEDSEEDGDIPKCHDYIPLD
jgi:hypothetical protein